MRRPLLVALSASILGATVLAATTGGSEDLPATGVGGRAVCTEAPLAFTDPIVLGDGQGYEPSVDVDSAGTIFVTAHKQSLAAEGTRTASWLWRSADDGASFEDMTGLLLEASDKVYALEGDLAVDANDNLYFVDTWAADNHAYRFSDHGETLDFVRPVVASAEVDDRPWLAAHGDGFVYYLSNTGFKHDGRLTIHRSTDGGQTFDPLGFTFPDSGWGFIDADPVGPWVYGVFDDLFYGTGLLGNAISVYAWASPDRGETWERSKIADFAHAPYNGAGYPQVAVSPVDGSVWSAWLDGDHHLMVAVSTDHGATWRVEDATPFAGSYAYAWLDVSADGRIGVVFSATSVELADRGVDPSADAHRPYAMVLDLDADCLTDPDDATSGCTEPVSGRYVALQVETAGDQADFFQVAFDPDGPMNVAYTDRDHGTVIEFVRQTAGANLDGRQVCGFSGSLLPGAPVDDHERFFEDV